MTGQANSSFLLQADCAEPINTQAFTTPPLSGNFNKDRLVAICGAHPEQLTSYMTMLAGISAPRSGKILLLDNDTISLTPAQQLTLRQRAGFVLQGGPLLSVINGKQNLLLPARYHGIGDETFIKAKAERLLADIPQTDQHLKLPAYMSRLVRRLLAIARPLMLDPQILFIDNPFDGLGYHDQNIVAEYMANIVKSREITLVVSCDDLFFTRKFADQVVFCAEDIALTFDNWNSFYQSDQPSIRSMIDQQQLKPHV